MQNYFKICKIQDITLNLHRVSQTGHKSASQDVQIRQGR